MAKGLSPCNWWGRDGTYLYSLQVLHWYQRLEFSVLIPDFMLLVWNHRLTFEVPIPAILVLSAMTEKVSISVRAVSKCWQAGRYVGVCYLLHLFICVQLLLYITFCIVEWLLPESIHCNKLSCITCSSLVFCVLRTCIGWLSSNIDVHVPPLVQVGIIGDIPNIRAENDTIQIMIWFPQNDFSNICLVWRWWLWSLSPSLVAQTMVEHHILVHQDPVFLFHIRIWNGT